MIYYSSFFYHLFYIILVSQALSNPVTPVRVLDSTAVNYSYKSQQLVVFTTPFFYFTPPNVVYTPEQVAARNYTDIRNSGLRTISERWIYFISRLEACLIRRGRGLLANENSASTFPGQQSFRRRAKITVNVGVLWERLYSASVRFLRGRSVLVTERALPTHAKWSAFYGVDLRSKYKPGFRDEVRVRGFPIRVAIQRGPVWQCC